MPIPSWVAAFNRHVTNRIARPMAARMPGFGVIVHTGRKSKRHYRTPVNVFTTPNGYLVALTYGADSDWVRNVLAAGGCKLETRGRVEQLTDPQILRDEGRRQVPRMVRPVLGLLDVAEFMSLTREPTVK